MTEGKRQGCCVFGWDPRIGRERTYHRVAVPVVSRLLLLGGVHRPDSLHPPALCSALGVVGGGNRQDEELGTDPEPNLHCRISPSRPSRQSVGSGFAFAQPSIQVLSPTPVRRIQHSNPIYDTYTTPAGRDSNLRLHTNPRHAHQLLCAGRAKVTSKGIPFNIESFKHQCSFIARHSQATAFRLSL